MKEEHSILTQLLDYSLETLTGLIAFLVGWVFKQVNSLKKDSRRQDEMIWNLEKSIMKEYVSVDMFNRGIEQLQNSHREHRLETNVKLDRILDKLENKRDK